MATYRMTIGAVTVTEIEGDVERTYYSSGPVEYGNMSKRAVETVETVLNEAAAKLLAISKQFGAQ